MNPRIRSAYDNCVEKEASKADSLIDRVRENIVPITLLTIGVGIPFLPGVADGAVKTAHIVMSMPETLGSLKANHPGIFYGLSAGLTSIGGLIAATGFLERKQDDPLRQQRQQEILQSAQKSWEHIVKTNDRVSVKVARHQQWLVGVMSDKTTTTTAVLKENGIDPYDRKQLLDLQKAYVFGVKQAFVAAEKEKRAVDLSPAVFDQFTTKNIAMGMADYYRSIGKASGLRGSADVRDLVKSGLAAIKDIQKKTQTKYVPDHQEPRTGRF